MTHCPRCKGHIVIVDQYEHGIKFKDYKCLNCGRYYPITIETAQVDVKIGRIHEYKPWRRVDPAIVKNARDLIAAGLSMAEASRMAGIHHASLKKIYTKNNWEYVQHKKSGRVKG